MISSRSLLKLPLAMKHYRARLQWVSDWNYVKEWMGEKQNLLLKTTIVVSLDQLSLFSFYSIHFIHLFQLCRMVASRLSKWRAILWFHQSASFRPVARFLSNSDKYSHCARTCVKHCQSETMKNYTDKLHRIKFESYALKPQFPLFYTPSGCPVAMCKNLNYLFTGHQNLIICTLDQIVITFETSLQSKIRYIFLSASVFML